MKKDSNMKSGLIVNVLRAKGYEECSLGGISVNHDTVLLVLPEGGPFDENAAKRLGIPVCKLVKRDIGGEYLHVEPDAEGSWAAGGCYVATSDSRFPNRYPLSLHDRDMRKEKNFGGMD